MPAQGAGARAGRAAGRPRRVCRAARAPGRPENPHGRRRGPVVRLQSRKRSNKLSTNHRRNIGKTMTRASTPRPRRGSAHAGGVPGGLPAKAGAAPAASAAPAAASGHTARDPRRDAGIVSSSHLVGPRSLELSELEFGLIVAWNAFSRWAVRCMAAAGVPDLTITDVLVLHHLQHRARNKKLADICFVLNYEDTHVVAYALKKLVAAGLVQADKQGKEVFYSPSAAGEEAVARYRAVREACLVDSLDTERNTDLGTLARLLRTMSGQYDQAARAASSL